MINIVAYSKATFEAFITNELVKKAESKTCFISILDPDNNVEKYTPAPNLLVVRMWDVDKNWAENGVVKYPVASDEELQKIVDFVNKHKDKRNCYVHCSAGISRSGAVARFMAEKFFVNGSKYEWKLFFATNKNILPNLYILKRLKELDNEYCKRMD